MKFRRSLPLALGLAGAAALAACSSSDNDNVPEATNVEAPLDEANLSGVAPTPEPSASPTPSPSATPTAAAAENLSADAQVMEDADAVGMTARVQRGEAEGNEAQPVD